MMCALVRIPLFVVLLAATAAAQDAPPPVESDGNQLTRLDVEQLQAMTTEALLRSADALIEEERYLEARPYVDVALRRNPDDAEALLLAGEVSLGFDDVQTARTMFRDVWDQDPNNFRANLGLGRIYLATRYARQSVNYLERAEQLAPPDRTPEVQRYLAEAHRLTGAFLKARVAADAAVKAEPNDLHARRTYAVVLLDAKRFEDAITHAERLQVIADDAFEANPGDQGALQDLITARRTLLQILTRASNEKFEMGPDGVRTDKPIPGQEKAIARLVKRIVDVRVQEAEAVRLLTYHDIADIASRVIEFDPAVAAYHRDLGLLLLEINREPAAIEALRAALELDPNDEVTRRKLEQLGALPESAAQSSAAGS